MADIKQAARWMQEDRKVRQNSIDANGFFRSNAKDSGPFGALRYERLDGSVFTLDNWLCVGDLLADDWEIVE